MSVTRKDLCVASRYLGVTRKYCKGGPEDVPEGAMSLGAARRAFPEATFSLEAGSGGPEGGRKGRPYMRSDCDEPSGNVAQGRSRGFSIPSHSATLPATSVLRKVPAFPFRIPAPIAR